MRPGRIIKYTLLALLLFITVRVIIVFIGLSNDPMRQPAIPKEKLPQWPITATNDTLACGPNRLWQNKNGLWELHIEGEAFERGYAAGRLMPELLHYQEKVFVDQIRQIIPSDSYLKFLRFMLILFNRDLGDCVPEENRREIYGISLSCSEEFNAIGTPYQRQLNYHAAHDIGHAMQDYMLVGCSSFGVWGSESADSSLLIGRNFDFYVGDDFAKNKLITFCRPDEGHRFVSVGWPGMTGVLSGMNEKGLTVTLNAAKSTMPLSAATPISILARRILQYASTIDEAFAIAEEFTTFVSESLLIGSAMDKKAAIIEKSPDTTALFLPEHERVICTNHFQSETFANDKRNQENIATSDSPYRYERLSELLDETSPVDYQDAAAMLRNYKGKADKSIGLGNEKAINQFIAHHSVIFQPEKQLMWVSTSPWQMGEYVAFNLEGQVDSLTIPADIFLTTSAYDDLLAFKRLKTIVRQSIENNTPPADLVKAENLIACNPDHFYAWELAGDWYAAAGDKAKAAEYWQTALTKEIPRLSERQTIEKKLQKFFPANA